jgi:hypothetical protein
MRTYRFRYLSLLLPMFVLFASCHKTPNHAQLIPKNALMVAEVNIKELSKKIAWSMITGSKLFDELKSKSVDSAKQSDFIKNMSEAGVDELNTFYAYVQNNGLNDKSTCFVALIPLKNAMKWETFLKKTFENTTIKDLKKRKETKLTDEIYAGWTNDLLIIITLKDQTANNYMNAVEDTLPQTSIADRDMLLASHLETAFSVTKENALLEDKRFQNFEKTNHDLGFWVNIEEVMNTVGAKSMSSITGGLSLSNTMWKNSAFSAGINFEKGKINTDMLVYSSDEMKEINQEFGKTNIDNDALDRVSPKGLDYVAAYHLSPLGVRKMLEKMGVSGLANSFLAEQKLSLQEILDAMSGDLIFSMNNFKQKKETMLFDSTDATSTINTFKTDMDMMFALKINKKETFKKVLNLAVANEMLIPIDDNSYMVKSMNNADTMLILLNDNYAVFSNKGSVARTYVAGSNPKQSSMFVKENVNKHPFGMFFDFQEWSKGMTAMMTGTATDSSIFEESKKTFENYVFNGGSFENNTFKYQMSVNFIDKKENSLLQLINFAKHIKEAQDIQNAKDAAETTTVADLDTLAK